MHWPRSSPERALRPFVFRHRLGARWAYTRDDAAQMDQRRHRLMRAGRDLAYLLLAVSGWFAVNLLAVLGCAVAAFLVISGGDLDSFFLHLNNLTSRYVDADLGRRAAFEHGLVQGFLLLLTLMIFLRAPGFIRRVRAELRSPRGTAA